MSESTEEKVPLKVQYGLKTLEEDAINRLLTTEKVGVNELSRIDRKWKYNKTDNFANPASPMSLSEFQSKSNSNEKKYVNMLQECYMSAYLRSKYYKESILNTYGETLGDVSNWTKVPTLDDFYRLNAKKPYSTDGQTITEQGKVALENLYKQYLQDVWPSYWRCEIYDNLDEVDKDSIDYTRLCEYTASEFSRDIANGAAGEDMTEEELKKMVSEVNIPTSLSLDAIADMIDQINEMLGTNTLKATLKAFIDQQMNNIVVNLVWNTLGAQISPYDPETNPDGTDYKSMSKAEFESFKEGLKETIKKQVETIRKEVEEKVKEMYKTASGVWDNVVAIPKSLTMMITAASIPQVIPTTGGIPNIARILLDIMNIVDQVLALIPPIIEGLAEILKFLKMLMIDPKDLPLIGTIIGLIRKLKESCGAAKEKNAQNLQSAENQITKDESKLETLMKKYERTDDEEKKAELKEQIDALTEQIASSKKAIQDYKSRVESDAKGEYETTQQLTGSLNLVTDTVNSLLNMADSISSLSNVDIKEEIRIPRSDTIIALERQDTTVTPYCGRVFQRL